MARDKEFEYRMQGMAYARQIALKDGIEGLDKEVKRRNITKIPMSTNQAELKRIWNELCENMYNNITVTFLYCLREEYRFGKKRMKRLTDKYQQVVKDVMDVDYMGEHYVRLDDYAVELREALGVELDVDRIAACQDVYDETGRDSQYHMAKVERIVEELRKNNMEDAAVFLERKLC